MKSFETRYHEPRVYAYSLPDVPKLNGWVKVGYTDRQSVGARIAQQLKTPLLRPHIEMDEAAVTRDGRFFRDDAVHAALLPLGFIRVTFPAGTGEAPEAIRRTRAKIKTLEGETILTHRI